MSFVNTQYTSENVQDTYNLIKSRKDDIPFNFAKRDMSDSTDIDFDANDYIGSHTTKVATATRDEVRAQLSAALEAARSGRSGESR